jgi:1-acyl-sn-glycerol-3-phosphate acyltransferase
MSDFLARQARRAVRLPAFVAAALYGLWQHRKLPRDASRRQSARWLQESCIRGLAAIHVRVTTNGPLPQRGIMVSNHLGYLDILAFSAAVPCVFVSKAEVEQWPLVGRYARWAGTVFVRRHDRSDAARANLHVAASLRHGVPVVLFPEGATSAGEGVLRFHSTMLQPAIDASAQITPCAIDYELDDGDVAQEVCWWGDMSFGAHLINLAGKKTIRARIAFGSPILPLGGRKQLSRDLHQEVVRLYRKLRAGEQKLSAESPPGHAG